MRTRQLARRLDQMRRGRRVDFCFRPLRLAYEYVTAGDLRDPVALLGQVAGVLAVRAHEVGADAPALVRSLN